MQCLASCVLVFCFCLGLYSEWARCATCITPTCRQPAAWCRWHKGCRIFVAYHLPFDDRNAVWQALLSSQINPRLCCQMKRHASADSHASDLFLCLQLGSRLQDCSSSCHQSTSQKQGTPDGSTKGTCRRALAPGCHRPLWLELHPESCWPS